jgi:alcohol dehydrogenase
MTKTTSAVLEQVGKINIKEFPIPTIGPNEGLLKIERAGVCGTDPKIYKGSMKVPKLPLILGHEIVGVVEEIGEEAAMKYGVQKGDRVVMEATVRCGYCVNCITGKYKFCENAKVYGIKASCDAPPYIWGAYGRRIYIAPGSIVHRISKNIPAERAVLINAIIANGIDWVRNAGEVHIGDTIVIQGVGQQGLASVIAAKESGAGCIVVTGLTRDSERLVLAEEFGADVCIDVEKEDAVKVLTDLTKGLMADVVVDVTGDGRAIQKSLDLVKKQGIVVNAGITGADKLTPLPLDKILFKEIRFQGVYAKQTDAILSAIKLAESGKYQFEKMVTHVFPLEDAEKALKTVGGETNEYPIKVILKP